MGKLLGSEVGHRDASSPQMLLVYLLFLCCYLLDNEEVEAVLSLELVGNVLQQAGQLYQYKYTLLAHKPEYIATVFLHYIYSKAKFAKIKRFERYSYWFVLHMLFSFCLSVHILLYFTFISIIFSCFIV